MVSSPSLQRIKIQAGWLLCLSGLLGVAPHVMSQQGAETGETPLENQASLHIDTNTVVTSGQTVSDEVVTVIVPKDKPLMKYRFSQRGGTVVSAETLNERYTRLEALRPINSVPEEKLKEGPLDLVSTWSPSYLPFRLVFNQLESDEQATLIIRRSSRGKIANGRLIVPTPTGNDLAATRRVLSGDMVVISSPESVKGSYPIVSVDPSGGVETERGFPQPKAEEVVFEIRRVGAVKTLFEQSPIFTRVTENKTQDPASIIYVWPNPAVDRSPLYIEKRFSVGGHAYELSLEVVLHNFSSGNIIIQPGMRVVGWQHEDLVESGGLGTYPTNLYAASCLTGESLERIEYPDLIEEPHELRTETRWVGVDTRYFLLAAALNSVKAAGQCRLTATKPPHGTISATLLAPAAESLGGTSYSCLPEWFPVKEGTPKCSESAKALGHDLSEPRSRLRKSYQLKRETLSGAPLAKVEEAWKRIKGRRQDRYEYTLFLGPKDTHYLNESGHALASSLDFGKLAFISEPMLKLLKWLHRWLGHWAWSIVALTVILKLGLLPLTQKSFVSMQKMTKLRPQLDKLKEEHGDNREDFARAQMALFKREGVNPLGGCLPMLVQMPIWFALYQTIYSSVELYHAPLGLWITDLSGPDPYYVLPVILGLLMLGQSFFTPTTPGMDPVQAKMMKYGMPLMFSVFMVALPAGLVLYIQVNTVLAIFQNIYIRRRMA